MFKPNRLVFHMIDENDVINRLGRKLPEPTDAYFQQIKDLDEIDGPREMVVMLDPKKPAEILDHPLLGPVLKPFESAIFVERYDEESKKIKVTLRSGETPYTIPVDNLGSVQLIHLVMGGGTEGDIVDDEYAVNKKWRDTAGRLKEVVGDIQLKEESALGIFLDGQLATGKNSNEIARALGIGLGNVAYNMDLYKSHPTDVYVDGKAPKKAELARTADPDGIIESTRNALAEIYLISDVEGEFDAVPLPLLESFGRGDLLSRVQTLVKFLAECPHNIMTCEVFVKTVMEMVKALMNVEMEIYGPEGAEEKGIKLTGSLDSQNLNLLKAVHQGSGDELGPFMIRVKYRPENAKDKKVHLLAGKTMVFDNGGDVAKGKAQEQMQGDMMGGATVAAELARMAEEETPVNVDFVFGVASNKTDGNSRNIDDIRVHADGETTEEKHPDAEGRQVLRDVIGASLRLSADEGDEIFCVTSVATLTGAAILAGGHRVLVMSDKRKLLKELDEDGHANGDNVQTMRLEKADAKAVGKTKRADVRNHAPEGAVPGQRGMQTGQAYIAGVTKEIPYVGFDIAAALDVHKGATPGDIQGEMSADGYLETLHTHLETAPGRLEELYSKAA